MVEIITESRPQHDLVYSSSRSPMATIMSNFDGTYWDELRLKGHAPERRSYHSSFVYDNRLFVFGGLDIREGSLSSLWELNLANLKDLDLEEGLRLETCGWKLIKTNGNPHVMPDRIAYHTSVVYKDNMFLFGGNNYKNQRVYDDEPAILTQMSFLNLKTMTWSSIKPRGEPVQ